MPSIVGAARPGRRKLTQEFDWSSVLLSVLGAFSVLLGCDMINTCCCCSDVAVCEACLCFFLFCFCIAPGGLKGPMSLSIKRPGHVVNAPGCLFTRARSQRPGGRSLLIATSRFRYALGIRTLISPSGFCLSYMMCFIYSVYHLFSCVILFSS